MMEARLGKKEGETMKYVSKTVEERRKRLQEQQEQAEKQRREIEKCFEDAKLD